MIPVALINGLLPVPALLIQFLLPDAELFKLLGQPIQRYRIFGQHRVEFADFPFAGQHPVITPPPDP